MDYKMFLNDCFNNQSNSTYTYPYCANLYDLSGPALGQPYPNRFVYVNQNFVNSAPPTSILINPNFKKTVHINPNFKANTPSIKSTIHVNPDILKLKKSDDIPRGNKVQPKPVVSTRTKLIRNCDGTAKRKRRKSLHTTYKIIRSGKCETPKTEAARLCYMKTKFKIDKIGPARFARNLTVKQVNKSKLLSINGVLYKKTPNVLKKATIQNRNVTKKNKVLRIGGHIYKLDSNRRTLKRIDIRDSDSNRLNVKQTFKQQIYTKSPNNRKLKLLSQIKPRGERILPNKLRKSNVPCPIYRKFGKCKGKENGSCIRIHNPNQITLCTRFLQGACLDKNCSLSHKVSPEKMPTCKYFLEGLCSKEDCPYLHVKINPKAPICKDFLEGFCKNAKECEKRHQFLCPEFERSRTCVRRRCPYPHGKMVRGITKTQNKVAKKVVKSRIAKSPPTGQSEVNHRYYKGKEEPEGNDVLADVLNDNIFSSIDRPKLGCLPSFIPLGETRLN